MPQKVEQKWNPVWVAAGETTVAGRLVANAVNDIAKPEWYSGRAFRCARQSTWQIRNGLWRTWIEKLAIY